MAAAVAEVVKVAVAAEVVKVVVAEAVNDPGKVRVLSSDRAER
jgi:hypothetical protein